MRKIKCLVYKLNSLAVFCYDDSVLFALCFTQFYRLPENHKRGLRGQEGRKIGNSMIDKNHTVVYSVSTKMAL